MFKQSTLKAAMLALAATLLGWTTQAQAANRCGIQGSATATGGVYDPFNPTANTAHVTLNMYRLDPQFFDPSASAGAKTAVVSFFLKSTNANADGISIIPTSVTGALTGSFIAGGNVFYDFAATAPFMGPPTSTTSPVGANRYIKIEFNGNNSASDPVVVQFDITVPSNLNLTASTVLPFDAIFRCTTTGGGAPTDQSGILGGAVIFPIKVLSALRTFYAGTALDFGEIGNIPAVPPSAIKTSAGNYVSVQSSGAYSVTLSSQNGFKLYKPGAAVNNDKVKYSLHFLGLDVDSTGFGPGATAISRNCVRAGLAVNSNTLPIQATLQEGGQGKNPSPTYADILTITVTPLISSDPGVSPCGTYGL